MPRFGFSYIGLIYLLMLFVPNILWTKRKPENYERYAQRENRVLLAFERTGEVLVCICVLIFADCNIRMTCRIVWLVLSFALMLLYEMYWIRYFRSKRTMADFYGSFAGVPAAGATLPVGAFLLLGIYGRNVFLLISTVLLGIGHISIHIQHRNQIMKDAQSTETA